MSLQDDATAALHAVANIWEPGRLYRRPEAPEELGEYDLLGIVVLVTDGPIPKPDEELPPEIAAKPFWQHYDGEAVDNHLKNDPRCVALLEALSTTIEAKFPIKDFDMSRPRSELVSVWGNQFQLKAPVMRLIGTMIVDFS